MRVRSMGGRRRIGMWIMLGAIDEAYGTFAAYQDTTRQNLQLELVFTEEAREFRQDPRFSDLAEDVGWEDYWKRFGGPDEN